jgi:hypothetical protein
MTERDTISYSRVRCRIINGTRDAVCIQGPDQPEWIPLSLIHGADYLRLQKAMRGDVLILRVADWKVRQIGLPVER